MNNPSLDALGLGHGLPKICVPITARDIAAFTTQLLQCDTLPGDLFEWRLDHYSGDIGLGLEMYAKTSRRPLLCTIRTKGQGGEAELEPEEYVRQVSELIEQGESFRLIDIELCAGDEQVKQLINAAHSKGLIAVVSQHDFTSTPSRQEMLDTLLHMWDLGADLPKLAVMPKDPSDLFDLMSASWEASTLTGPVVTMSMGPIGQLSRVAGSYTGSCITFGAGAEASAPGQLKVKELEQILKILGRGLTKE